MIATAIPHSAFDQPECSGRLDIIGRAGFIVDFVCHECGGAVACAREEDMGVALQMLHLAAGLTSIHCLRCGFANRIGGGRFVYGFACENCRRNFDLIPPKQWASRRLDVN